MRLLQFIRIFSVLGKTSIDILFVVLVDISLFRVFLFCFGAQMAMRANSLTAENKRRTLQRNDIAMAVSKTDTYDFLIDIVPREEVRCASPPARRKNPHTQTHVRVDERHF